MLNIVLVSENYANPFKGTIFTTEKQNKSKLKIYFYLGTNRRHFFIFNNLVLSTKLIM